MASGIAHDFNNALAPIMGYSDLLLTDPEIFADKETATGYIRDINTAATDAAAVVSRLNEFYRHRERDEVMLAVDVNEVVRRAISMTQPRWKDMVLGSGIEVSLETDLDPNPLSVSGNEAELRTVLTNLILNAVDAMPKGGTLTIRTRATEQATIVEVSDTGVGMSDDIRARVLEPFFSTKGESGSGLGLSMAHGIVGCHAGTVQIESEPGKGTTVTIQLPSLASPQVDTEIVTAAPTRNLHILVADDEPLVRKMLSEYLTADGHTFESTTNGREALEKFNEGTFDVVMSDRGMPEMNGDQLAAAIRKNAPDMPFIMLTGFGEMMEASDERPAGVDLIVGKPVTLRALREALAKVTSG